MFEHVDLPCPAEGVGKGFRQIVEDLNISCWLLKVWVGGRQGQVDLGHQSGILLVSLKLVIKLICIMHIFYSLKYNYDLKIFAW